MTRITADTNIYVSALSRGGKPKELLDLAAKRQIELCVSDAILNEVADVLARPKFGWSPGRIAEARDLIRSITTHVTPTQTLDVIKDDSGDNIFLECAAESRSNMIISGDKHLLRLKSYAGMPVIKAAEFLGRDRE